MTLVSTCSLQFMEADEGQPPAPAWLNESDGSESEENAADDDIDRKLLSRKTVEIALRLLQMTFLVFLKIYLNLQSCWYLSLTIT